MNLKKIFFGLGLVSGSGAVLSILAAVGWEDWDDSIWTCVIFLFGHILIFVAAGSLLESTRGMGRIRKIALAVGVAISAISLASLTWWFFEEDPYGFHFWDFAFLFLPVVAMAGIALPLGAVRLFVRIAGDSTDD